MNDDIKELKQGQQRLEDGQKRMEEMITQLIGIVGAVAQDARETNDNVKLLKTDLLRVKENVSRHDDEIGRLKYQ